MKILEHINGPIYFWVQEETGPKTKGVLIDRVNWVMLETPEPNFDPSTPDEVVAKASYDWAHYTRDEAIRTKNDPEAKFVVSEDFEHTTESLPQWFIPCKEIPVNVQKIIDYIVNAKAAA